MPFFSGNRNELQPNVSGALMLAGLGGALIVTLLVALGAKLALAGLLGVLFLFALVEWPIIGLVLVILSGTCFQVLGSEAITGLPSSVGKLAGMLTLVAWLYKFLRDRIAWTYSPQHVALLFYLLAQVVNTLLVRPAEPAEDNGFVRFLQTFLIYWLTCNLAGVNRRLLLVGVGSLTAGMAGCGIIGVLEHFVPSLSIESDDPALGEGAVGARIDRESLDDVVLLRITGGLGDSNWLAASLAAVIPLNLFWWWYARTWYGKALVVGMALLQVFALVLSYTRAGFLGLGVAVLFLVWRRVIAPQMLLWGGIATVLVGLIWLPPGFTERFFSAKYLQEGSTPIRKDLTGTALLFALERPILGLGFGQFGAEFIKRLNTDLSSNVGAWGLDLVRSVQDGREKVGNIGAHNFVIEIMVEYGLVGLAPFLAFIFLAFRDLRLAEKWGDDGQRLLALCLAAGLVAFCVCGMFIHAKYLKILWFLAGLAAAQRRVILTEFWRPDAPPMPDGVAPAAPRPLRPAVN